MFTTGILLIEFSVLGRVCVCVCDGGLVSAPQIISATSPGNPSLTDAVTTLLRQNAVA